MAEIRVSPDNVRYTASKIRNHNTQANGVLDQIVSSLYRLRSSGDWEGRAATDFFTRFDELKRRIEKHRVVIDQYAAHLNKAAAEYENSDDYAKQQAETINVRRR